MTSARYVVFAGPTLYADAKGALPVPAEVCLLPPARRGDVAALIKATPPGALALVDGLFHSHLAVGHEELRNALQAGWQVWGLASMGAIRAYEMRHLGMRGFGQVYARFETEFDFQDDEVALLHAPDPPYQSVSEPLVHFRAALEDWEQRGLLSGESCAAITVQLKSLWYGDRTLRLFTALVRDAAPLSAWPGISDALANFAQYRLKTRDLQAFLQTQPWSASPVAPASVRSDA